jgi:DNA-binding MarR family transcriptional regulator
MNAKHREESMTLEILQAIDARSDVTQRHLASHMGVALGLANSYLKRCVRKGLVKVQQAPANRYLYYLTPKGFAEKSRLTANYLSYSFGFYRRASESCAEVFRVCEAKRYQRVGLYGFSDLAEIAALRAMKHQVELVCLLDPDHHNWKFLDLPVLHDQAQAPELDAWLFTDLTGSVERLHRLCESQGQDRVLVPSILGLNTDT